MPTEHQYLRVFNGVVRQIESGEIAVGDPIPTAAELQQQYKVSNTAVRMAVLLLKERGYVEGMQGKRVYVKERRQTDGV